jgi:hypothetical protein
MSRGSAQSFTFPGAAASAISNVGHSSRTANMSRCNGDSDSPMSTNLDVPSFPGQAARRQEPVERGPKPHAVTAAAAWCDTAREPRLRRGERLARQRGTVCFRRHAGRIERVAPRRYAASDHLKRFARAGD